MRQIRTSNFYSYEQTSGIWSLQPSATEATDPCCQSPAPLLPSAYTVTPTYDSDTRPEVRTTTYDKIALADADDQCRVWTRKLINAKDEIIAFVDASPNGQGTGEYLGFFKGSFNISFHIGFGRRHTSALIRFRNPVTQCCLGGLKR